MVAEATGPGIPPTVGPARAMTFRRERGEWRRAFSDATARRFETSGEPARLGMGNRFTLSLHDRRWTRGYWVEERNEWSRAGQFKKDVAADARGRGRRLGRRII